MIPSFLFSQHFFIDIWIQFTKKIEDVVLLRRTNYNGTDNFVIFIEGGVISFKNHIN